MNPWRWRYVKGGVLKQPTGSSPWPCWNNLSNTFNKVVLDHNPRYKTHVAPNIAIALFGDRW